MTRAELLYISAAADLERQNRLPDNEDAAARAVAQHLAAYAARRVRFPLLTAVQANTLLSDDGPGLSGWGLKKKLKKGLKKLKNAVKTAAPILVGTAAAVATGNPAIGLQAAGAVTSLQATRAQANAAEQIANAEVAAINEQTAQAIAATTAKGAEIAAQPGFSLAGLPPWAPWAAVGGLVLVLLARR